MSTHIAVGQTGWEKEEEIASSKVTEEFLHREISFLSDSLCNGRSTGTRGNIEAGFWITRKFKAAGLMPLGEGYAKHFTTPNGTIGHNIVGFLPGSYTVPRDKYIIIGAHYDHIGNLNGHMYPGADSNASGTVVMTTLADIFSAMREMGKVYNSSIIFVAFDAKEMAMSGSQNLWKLIDYKFLKDPISGERITKDKIQLMVNIDQIGSSIAPVTKGRPDYLIMLGNNSLMPDDRENIKTCNRSEKARLDLCLSYYGSETFTKLFYRLSDQKVFVDNNIPAVMFTSGITMNTNKTYDRVENLDIPILNKRIALIYNWLETLLQ